MAATARAATRHTRRMAHSGVLFPEAGGKRSTSALGRSVVADALLPVDPVGAAAARAGNQLAPGLPHALPAPRRGGTALGRRCPVDRRGGAGLTAPADAGHHTRRRGAHRRGVLPGARSPRPSTPRPSPAPPPAPASCPCRSTGSGCAATPCTASSTPGQRQARWSPPARRRCGRSRPTPTGSTSPGSTVVVLGAGAEMGPLRAVLSWGAEVVGVDLPRPDVWKRVLETARGSAGTLHVPVPHGSAVAAEHLEERAGADLLHDLPRSPTGSPASPHRSCSATTSTPTAPPTCASRWPSTPSPRSCCTAGTTWRWPSSRRRPTSSPSPRRPSSTPPAATAAPQPACVWRVPRCAR